MAEAPRFKVGDRVMVEAKIGAIQGDCFALTIYNTRGYFDSTWVKSEQIHPMPERTEAGMSTGFFESFRTWAVLDGTGAKAYDANNCIAHAAAETLSRENPGRAFGLYRLVATCVTPRSEPRWTDHGPG